MLKHQLQQDYRGSDYIYYYIHIIIIYIVIYIIIDIMIIQWGNVVRTPTSVNCALIAVIYRPPVRTRNEIIWPTTYFSVGLYFTEVQFLPATACPYV